MKQPVVSDGDGCKIKGSESLPDLLEGVAVSGVAPEPEAPAAVVGAEDCPAAPEDLASVERRSLAPVIGWCEHKPVRSWVQSLLKLKIMPCTWLFNYYLRVQWTLKSALFKAHSPRWVFVIERYLRNWTKQV